MGADASSVSSSPSLSASSAGASVCAPSLGGSHSRNSSDADVLSIMGSIRSDAQPPAAEELSEDEGTVEETGQRQQTFGNREPSNELPAASRVFGPSSVLSRVETMPSSTDGVTPRDESPVAELTSLFRAIAPEWKIITLEKCVDRQELCKEEMERVGLSSSSLAETPLSASKRPLCMFCVNKKDKENTIRGCFTSHYKAIDEAYRRGLPFVGMLEDDFLFPRDLSSLKKGLENAARFIADRGNDGSWRALYLGHLVDPFHLDLSKVIRRVPNEPGIATSGSLHMTHAYILSREGMEEVLSQPWKSFGDHYDRRMSQLGKVFTVFPQVCYQRDCLTENDIGVGLGYMFVNQYVFVCVCMYGSMLSCIDFVREPFAVVRRSLSPYTVFFIWHA